MGRIAPSYTRNAEYPLHQHLPKRVFCWGSLHPPDTVARSTAQPQPVVPWALDVILNPVSIAPVDHAHPPRPLARGFNPDILG